jgi:hypothetical protein
LWRRVLNKRTIVFLVYIIAFFFFRHSQGTPEPVNNGPFQPPKVIASVSNSFIDESSGVASSRKTPGLLWTHNDSGDGPFIYAMDRSGSFRGVFKLSLPKPKDWEDIAVGPGKRPGEHYVYLGDIGNNSNNRQEFQIHILPEPVLSKADRESSRKRARVITNVRTIKFRYPDGNFDSEALMVHPRSGDIYVVTKEANSRARVYKAPSASLSEKVITLAKIADLRVPALFGGRITGGDISPDGRNVALCDYMFGYELRLPDRAEAFDSIWKQPLNRIMVGLREQGESICYSHDGSSLLATSEGNPFPIIEILRARK